MAHIGPQCHGGGGGGNFKKVFGAGFKKFNLKPCGGG